MHPITIDQEYSPKTIPNYRTFSVKNLRKQRATTFDVSLKKIQLQLLQMNYNFLIHLIFLSLPFFTEAEGIKSARLLDLVIRDYTFQSYNKNNFRTGKLHPIHLPSNLTGIEVDSVRFRCGSLTRYGAKIQEFHLGVGIKPHPCVERVLIVRQNLGSNWSSIYYSNFELTGYQLISPVLGLLAYNAGDNIKFSTPFEINIEAGKDPMKIDFSKFTENKTATSTGIIPLCASFEQDGKVTLSNQASGNVCVSRRHGHFGLVVESPMLPLRRNASRWKIAVGSSIGAALGAFLIGLLLIALFVKVKRKKRMEELVRRAYEEEALQVSMVGHVRALTAPGSRTSPTIEHQDSPSP